MRDRRRLLLLLPAIWVLALLALPAVLWLGGERQPLLESRPKEPFPPLNRHTFADPAAIRDLDTALLDRLPGRDKALDLHARIANDLFHDSSSPDVAIGDDGYLYYVPDLLPCRPEGAPVADPADAAEIVARTLVASGRTTAVVVPRSKLFAHDADAPAIDAGMERCVERMERRIDERLASVPGGLSFSAAQRAREEAGESTFLLRDTHWNWRGRVLFANAVLDRVQPGLAAEVGLHADGDYQRAGDLDKFLGRARTETDGVVTPRRPPADPPPPGSVVLIGDSQLETTFVGQQGEARPLIEQVLPGAVYCNWSMLLAQQCDDAIRNARAVVVEKVAREMRLFTQACWLPVALAAERLRGVPARLQPLDGAVADGDALRLSAATAAVAVEAPADRAAHARLIRIPVTAVPAAGDGTKPPVTLAQEPRAGAPAPCATPAASEGGALLLPVPAGQRLSDMRLRIAAPAGTLLGRPREIALEG